MSFFARLPTRAWLLVPLCACGFLAWGGWQRALRVDAVTNTDRDEAVVDAASPTGYAGGKRWLIVPEHNNRSYQWIAETQQMLAHREWRVRRVDYENAPVGREVHSASPYRWWLGLIAKIDHALSGRPAGLSVERAALWADPILHLLLLIGTTFFAARWFGPFSAGLLAVGLVTLYPFAGGFLPGVPDIHGLSCACAAWSVLPLLAAAVSVRPPDKRANGKPDAAETAETNRRIRRRYLLAGIAGGCGLWLGPADQAPVVAGIAFGAILAAWLTRGTGQGKPAEPAAPPPWRTWALGGAITCLLAYVIEYFSAHMDLRLQANHPLYGVAWLGLGELLTGSAMWAQRGRSYWNRGEFLRWVLALLAVAALPVTLRWNETQLLLTGDLLASRLTSLPGGVVAKDLATWFARDGMSGPVVATCLPALLLVLAALAMIARRQTSREARGALAVALGPALVALVLACFQLRWWSLADGLLLALFAAIVAAAAGRLRGLWSGIAAGLFLPGLLLLVPPAGTGGNLEFTRLEAEGLIERALAHWITDHTASGSAVLLLPPDRTPSWCFHSGLRGIGTANWENRDGLAATIRIVTATTADEAQALINQRGITHIILPSWDPDLDAFAGWTLRNPEDAFVMALHHWALPPWLRPLPYNLPVVAGFEGQSVAILEVTDESNRVTALSRLAEYFIETQQLALAAESGRTLQRYPADLKALIALAEVEKARGDAEAFNKAFGALVAGITSGADRTLPWDRRVSLAIVLALGDRNDLARDQVRRCLEKLDETKIRSLTTASLYRLQVLGKAFDLPISDPGLRALAVKLLPAELRARL